MSSPTEAKPVVLKCPQCGAGLPPGSQGYTVCQYCGSSLVLASRSGEVGRPEPTVVRGMRLKMFTYTDREGTGLELFRMLVPVGWQFRGGCYWLLDNPSMPAVVSCQLWNPQGAEAFEILPNMNLVWNNAPMARMMQPIGSRHFGAEVRPPMGIAEAMQQLVVPRYRSQVQNLQLLGFEPLPEFPRLAKSEAAVSGGSAEGGKLRIRYTWQGAQFDEDIYGMVEIFRAPIATAFSMGEIIVWFVDALFSFRAAVGRLDATADLFTVMIRSFQLNPHWYAAFKSIAQYLSQMQIQRIQHVGQIGQILARTGSEIREQNLQQWYSRQAIYDRISVQQSRTIRGVDGFFDPHREEVVELPSGYGHAWANNLGEYILTEDPNFNPNVHSNLHWEPMQQQ